MSIDFNVNGNPFSTEIHETGIIHSSGERVVFVLEPGVDPTGRMESTPLLTFFQLESGADPRPLPVPEGQMYVTDNLYYTVHGYIQRATICWGTDGKIVQHLWSGEFFYPLKPPAAEPDTKS